MKATHRIALGALALAACGPEVVAPGSVATVVFQYEAPTTTDPGVAEMFPGCVNGVGQTHLHAGWRGFAARTMNAVSSELWEITYTDVPVGAEQRIRVSDPNTCAANATGASTDGVSANGMPLDRVVDTPGSGVEPGLAFTVLANGTIQP